MVLQLCCAAFSSCGVLPRVFSSWWPWGGVGPAGPPALPSVRRAVGNKASPGPGQSLEMAAGAAGERRGCRHVVTGNHDVLQTRSMAAQSWPLPAALSRGCLASAPSVSQQSGWHGRRSGWRRPTVLRLGWDPTGACHTFSPRFPPAHHWSTWGGRTCPASSSAWYTRLG